jgi:hypothetical protein
MVIWWRGLPQARDRTNPVGHDAVSGLSQGFHGRCRLSGSARDGPTSLARVAERAGQRDSSGRML